MAAGARRAPPRSLVVEGCRERCLRGDHRGRRPGLARASERRQGGLGRRGASLDFSRLARERRAHWLQSIEQCFLHMRVSD